MISNIINKEFYSLKDKINIVWTNPESGYFTEFIKKACGNCSLVDFDKTYYGFNDIHIVICNNRLVYLDKCVELSKFFHVPLLIVDHSVKSNMVNSEFVLNKIFEPIYQVAISKDIHFSWGKIHDMIIEYDDSKISMEKWKNLLFQLIKTRFIAQEPSNENQK